MSVYVDDMQASFGRMIMCHMLADTHEELCAMAEKIGVQLRWLQHADTPKEHFDISLTKRRLAVHYGAVEITWEEAGKFVAARRTKTTMREDLPA